MTKEMKKRYIHQQGNVNYLGLILALPKQLSDELNHAYKNVI